MGPTDGPVQNNGPRGIEWAIIGPHAGLSREGTHDGPNGSTGKLGLNLLIGILFGGPTGDYWAKEFQLAHMRK